MRPLLLLLLVGCGRLAFDPIAGGGGPGIADGGTGDGGTGDGVGIDDDSGRDAPGSGGLEHIGGGTVTRSSTATVSFTVDTDVTDPDAVIIVQLVWYDTVASVASIGDSNGNTYTPPLGTARSGTALSQALFHAPYPPSAPGTIVTLVFDRTVAMSRVRWAMYRGVDTAAIVDGKASQMGAGTTLDSGPVTVTGDRMLFAAVATAVTTPAMESSYRVLSSGAAGAIAEKAVAAGTYNATATSTATSWIVQLIGLRPR